MKLKPGSRKHSDETKARIAEGHRARWQDPAERQRVSEATKARMADPAVRQRIRDGMLAATGETDELRMLRMAWRAARAAVRRRFLDELLRPACEASALKDGGSK